MLKGIMMDFWSNNWTLVAAIVVWGLWIVKVVECVTD